MNIDICDDDIQQTEYTRKFISSFMEKTCPWIPMVYQELTPEQLIVLLENSTFCADIIILDIRMDVMDGIQLAKKINRFQTECQIVFFTGFIDYAPLVYEAEHLYFVLKTQMADMLPKALEKAMTHLNAPVETISLCVSNHNVELPTNKILYIEKMGHQSILHTDQKQLTVSLSLRELLDMFPSTFLRCHGGYIINLRHVYSYISTSFTLKNQVKVPIGRTFQHASKKAYLHYLSSNL